MRPGTDILALIKPQFEAGKENVGKGGIVKDPEIRNQVKQDVILFFQNRGYKVNGTVTSPVLGAKGNEEYVISLVYGKK
jgi:23S rRNA (cytidine1920-2'-O)/16S rRNA (cytidine1409-2'-O)-methyltransferase